MIEKGGCSPHNGRKHLPMNSKTTAADRYSIVYDADQLDTASVEMFQPRYWQQHGGGDESTLERGGACYISGPFGDAVLKRYFRGGLVARWNRDLYLYLGIERSRPFREFRLLEWMHSEQLPVPAPLAALVHRTGPVCRGGLITALLPDTESFARRLEQGRPDIAVWQSVGRCVRRFHDCGVQHADLNVNNILLDTAGKVYLVDFDKSRRCDNGGQWKLANLQRLKRSLGKIMTDFNMDHPGWRALTAAYDGSD
jgi:3-deoxy-D-manno-octulosonic acid kinase